MLDRPGPLSDERIRPSRLFHAQSSRRIRQHRINEAAALPARFAELQRALNPHKN
jgi:hypothetical protein